MDPNNAPGAGAAPPMDTSNLQVPIITVWVVMTSLATITVCMRFYTRRMILHILGVEDWLILVAMILSIGATVGFIRQTFFGLGRHIWTLSPDLMMKWGIEQFYSFLFYTMSLAFAKVSIMFLYMRIMVHGVQRTANYVLLGIIVACNIWVFIGQFIQCIPLRALWDPSVPGTCLGVAVNIGNSVLHIITDFFIFLLPIPTLLKLKINTKRKIGLIVVFSLGFFVCVISIIRMVTITYLDFSDMPYNFAVLSHWSAVEVNLAIICACLTTLKPLVARFFPKLLGSSMASRYGGKAAHNTGSRYGGVSRGGGGPPIDTLSSQRQKRHTTIEEREFSRLDDESVKSEQGLVPSYQLEIRGKTGDGHHGVTRPERSYVHS